MPATPIRLVKKRTSLLVQKIITADFFVIRLAFDYVSLSVCLSVDMAAPAATATPARNKLAALRRST
jgi:hypothetical protein